MKMNLLVSSVAALLMAACSAHNPQALSGDNNTAIYGGDDVKAADVVATTTVGLYNSKVGYLCTGSLYGHNMVITAAHCLEGNAADIQVRFGVDMRHPTVIRKVVSGQKNEHYTGQIKPNMGDVSILKYEGSIPPGFTAAPLLTNYSVLSKGAKIVAAGYGISSPTRKKGDGILRKITLKVKDPLYSSTEVAVNQSMFSGVCSGDSGGPAFIQGADGKLYLWGVTSNGAGIPILRPCLFFAIFTRVDTYLPWFTVTAGKL